jgi:hypothetical protein
MNIMDHEQAVKMDASERYLLNQLTIEERDDFEAHYFVCRECAEDVRITFAFADNAKAVLSQQGEEKRVPVESRARASWLDWLKPAWAPAAAAILLSVTLYQSLLVIPELQKELSESTAARPLPTVVAMAATRGDVPGVQISPNERFFHLVLDINTTGSVSSYLCQVRNAAGELVFEVNAPAPPAGGSLNLLLPASGLKSGRYAVTIRASGSDSQAVLGTYSFTLERQGQ